MEAQLLYTPDCLYLRDCILAWTAATAGLHALLGDRPAVRSAVFLANLPALAWTLLAALLLRIPAGARPPATARRTPLSSGDPAAPIRFRDVDNRTCSLHQDGRGCIGALTLTKDGDWLLILAADRAHPHRFAVTSHSDLDAEIRRRIAERPPSR